MGSKHGDACVFNYQILVCTREWIAISDKYQKHSSVKNLKINKTYYIEHF